MKHSVVVQVSLLITLLGFVGLATELKGAIVFNSVNMEARQQVTLLGVSETLVATGPVNWTFDVDANNNSILGGGSKVEAQFTGALPGGFGGLAGAPFVLFSLPGNTVTVTNNGTHVRALTNFGLRVFDGPNSVLAEFFTSTPSIFESDVVSLTNFVGSVFQDPLRPNDSTDVFISSGLGLPFGSLVGNSFNRTVTAVPEPSSLILCALAGALALKIVRRSKK